MSTMYEVIMIDGHCPQETCSMGLYKTEEQANDAIKRESVHYSDHMIFEIEVKYVRS